MSDYTWFGVYDGYVYDNRDPLLIGRIRAVVPGLVEPYTAWALPMCNTGGGSDARGFWSVPPVGSNVSVMFRAGDIDQPRYLASVWAAPNGVPQSPTFVRELSPSEAVEITGIQTKKWEIVADDRDGNTTLTLRDRAHPTNVIRIDGDQQTVSIEGTVAVQIKSTGVVSIEALQIVLNGRVVLPTSKPI